MAVSHVASSLGPRTVLSPDEARQFAAELKRIADVIDLLPDRERGE
jgi:hypothetical protein